LSESSSLGARVWGSMPRRGRARGLAARLIVSFPRLAGRPGGVPDIEASLPEGTAEHVPAPRSRRVPVWVWLLLILGLAAFLRAWHINALGYNSDEAVYGGQGAAIAHDGALEPYFPAFRAHPLLFQTLLSVGYHLGIGEIFGRLASAALGVVTVYLVFLTGRRLYGSRVALLAALFLAVMPYHVVVTRQVLLDGPMVLFATLTLYLVARFGETNRSEWLYAAGASMGLTLLSKETGIVLMGSIFAFLALTPKLKIRIRPLLLAFGAMGLILSAVPIVVLIAGKTKTGGNFLAWQLFRRPNHDAFFYPTQVTVAMGLLLVAAAAAGLWLLRRETSWRETLLVSWIVVPVVFFELWPVKGFQYLLPLAPAVALLGARAVAGVPRWSLGAFARSRAGREPGRLRATLGTPRSQIRLTGAIAAAITLSLLASSWARVNPSSSASFLAGSGGVPGGRETGVWIKEHIPHGAQMLTLGPSMANILEYYGHRKAYGLSVSPNPLHRNPVYEPVKNPDRMIRANEVQYLVWDVFSAKRSKFFSRRLIRYVERYHGRVVHQETVWAKTQDGHRVRKPIITVYEVRP
jgi:hypothetical protein